MKQNIDRITSTLMARSSCLTVAFLSSLSIATSYPAAPGTRGAKVMGPVNFATGGAFLQIGDVTLQTRDPLLSSRYPQAVPVGIGATYGREMRWNGTGVTKELCVSPPLECIPFRLIGSSSTAKGSAGSAIFAPLYPDNIHYQIVVSGSESFLYFVGGTTKDFEKYDSSSGRLTAISEGGLITRFEYNTNGTLRLVTDPSGNATTFNYNAAGDLFEIVGPSGDKETLIYVDRRLVQQDGPGGPRYYILYDAFQRPVGIKDAYSKVTLTVTYNVPESSLPINSSVASYVNRYNGTEGEAVGDRRVLTYSGSDVSVTENSGTVTYRFNSALGSFLKLTNIYTPYGNASYNYSGDRLMEIISTSTPLNGNPGRIDRINYAYTSSKTGSGLPLPSKVSLSGIDRWSFTYNARGILTQTKDLLTNVLATTGLDSFGRPVSYSSQDVSKSWTYEGNCLKGATSNGKTVSATVDSFTCLPLSITASGVTENYSYSTVLGVNKVLTQASNPYGTLTYSYTRNSEQGLDVEEQYQSSDSNPPIISRTSTGANGNLLQMLDSQGRKRTLSMNAGVLSDKTELPNSRQIEKLNYLSENRNSFSMSDGAGNSRVLSTETRTPAR